MRALGLIIALLAGAAAAGEDRLQAFHTPVDSLDARFEQRLLDEEGQTLEVYSGHFSLVRPNRFLWVYESPFPLHLGSDGDTLWHHDLDLRQITLRDADAVLSGTPAELLGGEIGRLDQFEIVDAGNADELAWVELRPRAEDGDFARIRIGFSADLPRQLELEDRLGQLTRIQFSELVVNDELPADRFVLRVPEGVDVVDERAP